MAVDERGLEERINEASTLEELTSVYDEVADLIEKDPSAEDRYGGAAHILLMEIAEKPGGEEWIDANLSAQGEEEA